MKLLWIFFINGIFRVSVSEIKKAYSMTMALIAGGNCSRSAKIEK